MKSPKAKKSKGPTDATPVVANVVPVGYSYTEPTSNDPAERIKYHLSQAHVAANVAMRHIIEAGWELAKQKQFLGYGQWTAWCEQSIEISQKTADKYIDAFRKTVGAQRAQQSIGLGAKLLKKELDAATVGMEEKTVRQAMLELGVIKPTPGHGGAREGAGRKPKNAAAEKEEEQEEEMVELDKVAETHANAWSIVREHLRKLQDEQRDHQVIDRLDLVELAEAHSILESLYNAAQNAIKRLEKSLTTKTKQTRRTIKNENTDSSACNTDAGRRRRAQAFDFESRH